MPDHAIVIGIDVYRRPEWTLQAAVRDALAFARWVTADGAGRATRETLTLLLSPKPGAEPADLAFAPATRDAINTALYRYARKRAGDGADRLWFFYAGHGVTPPQGAPDAAPVLVPADVDDMAEYLFDAPLMLHKYLAPLQVSRPATQIFFVDACRGLVDSDDGLSTTTQLHFDLAKLGDLSKAIARQAVLYATTAGRLANELGLHGLFGKALMEGLSGAGPELTPNAERLDLELRFDALTRFTQRRVRELGDVARKRGKALPTQDPSPDLFNVSGELPLARFAVEALPKAQLKVLVQPSAAATAGKASIQAWDAMLGTFALGRVKGPPLPDPATWDLAFGQYRVIVDAPGFKAWNQPVDLSGDQTLVAQVELAPAVFHSFAPESFAEHPAALRMAAHAGTKGDLLLRSSDRLARIELFDASGARVAAGWGHLALSGVRAGPYRAEVALPGQAPVDRAILVTPGRSSEVLVDPAASHCDPLERALAGAGIQVAGGISDPSEAFGLTTTTLVGSVLAWGAWAARFPEGGMGQKLRHVGVDALASAGAGDAMLEVLVGDVGPPPGSTTLLDAVTVAVGALGREQPVTLAPVQGLLFIAKQWAGPVPGVPTSVLVHAPDLLQPTSLPVPFVPGYVSVVVIAREADGRIEIHRYLQQLHPEQQGNAMFSDDIRRAEQGWRALDARTSLLPGEAEDLIALGRLDPLAIAVLGYRLAREGREALLDAFGPSGVAPLARALQEAPALADLHVLSALAAKRRAEDTWEDHLANAAATGVPLVADGYGILSGWLTARAAENNQPPPVPLCPVTAGSVWSTFDARVPQAPLDRRAIPVAALRSGSPAWADRILAVAAATACIRMVPSPHPLSGTGFLVATGVLATMRFCLEATGAPLPPDGGAFAEGLSADFEPGDGARRFALRTLRTTLRVTPEDRSGGVALVGLEHDGGAAPVHLQWTAPYVGQRIAVVGHPVLDSRAPAHATTAAFTSAPVGDKTVMPGEVVDVDPSGARFTYACWTLGGTAGGPIVDLETGAVIGVHVGGHWIADTSTKQGFGVPLAALRDVWVAAGAPGAP